MGFYETLNFKILSAGMNPRCKRVAINGFEADTELAYLAKVPGFGSLSDSTDALDIFFIERFAIVPKFHSI